MERAQAALEVERQNLRRERDEAEDEPDGNPACFLDLAIGGVPAGRLEVVLQDDAVCHLYCPIVDTGTQNGWTIVTRAYTVAVPFYPSNTPPDVTRRGEPAPSQVPRTAENFRCLVRALPWRLSGLGVP